MKMMLNKTLNEFNGLNSAVIDSSSIIYMKKAGFLQLLSNRIKLITPEQAAAETGLNLIDVEIVEFENPKNYETDCIIVKTAFEKKLPVISEDKEILQHAAEKNLPYFNSLMMLCFLLSKKTISAVEYENFLGALKDFAWYSGSVYKYADELHKIIICNNG